MRYPENLKIGDTIGICAPSCGIVDADKQIKLDKAIKQLTELGYKVIETESVRTEFKGRSASAKKRAEEFIELYKNPEVKLILFATGGDFLCEVLDYLNFDELKILPPKWMQGYSDITGIEFMFNTILEIPSIYSQTVKDYAMRPLHESLINPLKLLSGEKLVQNSFDLYEKEWFTEDVDNPNYLYNLTEKVSWNNLKGEDKIEIEGRAIGGCLDCIQSFFATKYDNILNYIEKYKDDGFVWYFDVFEMSTPMLYRVLWQMKNAGYFKYTNGIVFGRPLFIRDDYEISFNETILDAIKDLNIPIITDADIGHRAPQMAITNGAILKFISEKGKGRLETLWK